MIHFQSKSELKNQTSTPTRTPLPLLLRPFFFLTTLLNASDVSDLELAFRPQVYVPSLIIGSKSKEDLSAEIERTCYSVTPCHPFVGLKEFFHPPSSAGKKRKKQKTK